MSEQLEKAAAKLREKLEGKDFEGSVKFDVPGEGAILVDADGVRVGEGDAELTVSGDIETFKDMFSGDLDPTSAFMTGKITVDGESGSGKSTLL
ncbi:MAG: SCP2 sterol-binding domain-containing protein, partial [Pseudomonadota bacterium]